MFALQVLHVIVIVGVPVCFYLFGWMPGPQPGLGAQAPAGGSYNAISVLLEHLDISTRSVLVVVVVGP